MNNVDIVLLMFGLITKHFICDFLLQFKYQYSNKHIFGHPGGLLHAGIHVIGTTITASCIVPEQFMYILVLASMEGILHYIIDFLKMNSNLIFNLTPDNSEAYWWLLGFDQYLHYICYIGIISAVVYIA